MLSNHQLLLLDSSDQKKRVNIMVKDENVFVKVLRAGVFFNGTHSSQNNQREHYGNMNPC